MLFIVCLLFFWQPRSASSTASQLEAMQQNNTIAVTAWYAIGKNAKAPEVKYHYYLYNFRHFETPTVMFTNEPEFFASYPEFDNLYIVEDSIENMQKRTGYSVQDWQKQHDLDSENFRHSLELYYIWIGRAFLLMESMKLFPNAEWFFWVDSGGARNEGRWSFPRFIQSSGLPDDRMIMFTPRKRSEFPCFGEDTMIPSVLEPEQDHLIREDCIQGGAYGGSRKAIELFTYDFKQTLRYFFHNDLFAGKDQCVFNYMYVKEPYKYAVFGANDNFDGDRWFWFFHFLQFHQIPLYPPPFDHYPKKETLGKKKTRTFFQSAWNQRFPISLIFNALSLIYFVYKKYERRREAILTYGLKAKASASEQQSFLGARRRNGRLKQAPA